MKRSILTANGQFYDAVRRRSFLAMANVWEQSTRATCVHPGEPILRGWNAIADSWVTRLPLLGASTDFLLTNAAVTIEGDLAWVVLDEDLIDHEIKTKTFATINLFARHDDRWLMVAHHASMIST